MTRDELITLLYSEETNPYGFDPVATHGFLTASIVGKPLPNWLSVYFDGHDKEVSDEVKTALSVWREEIYQTLKDEAPVEMPFDADDNEEDFSEDSDVVVWCIGFIEAMYGDERVDWFDDPDTEEDVAELTLPMVILSGMDEESEELNLMRQDIDMMAQLANSLESNVTELFLLFHTDD